MSNCTNCTIRSDVTLYDIYFGDDVGGLTIFLTRLLTQPSIGVSPFFTSLLV